MDQSPPFDPPYTAVHESADGMRVTAFDTDGMSRDITSTSHGQFLLHARLDLGPKTMEQANKPVSSAKRIPGNGRAALFLNVPFAEKDSAKSLGAKWDATLKKWYVPHGLDINIFENWWPDGPKS